MANSNSSGFRRRKPIITQRLVNRKEACKHPFQGFPGSAAESGGTTRLQEAPPQNRITPAASRVFHARRSFVGHGIAPPNPIACSAVRTKRFQQPLPEWKCRIPSQRTARPGTRKNSPTSFGVAPVFFFASHPLESREHRERFVDRDHAFHAEDEGGRHADDAQARIPLPVARRYLPCLVAIFDARCFGRFLRPSCRSVENHPTIEVPASESR